MTIKGKFITFEGVDGAGKSTHIDDVISFLEAQKIAVKRTREPGGTKLGEKLRELLLYDDMDPETETLLMFAARRQHIAEIIKPALDAGIFVLSDRFTDATYAYQYGGKQVAYSKIQILEAWVHPDLKADLTLLFDLPVEISIDRLKKNRAPDKFEKESEAFFTWILQGKILVAIKSLMQINLLKLCLRMLLGLLKLSYDRFHLPLV
jgi:dTMP kinase